MPWNFTLVFFLTFRFFKAKANTDRWAELWIWFAVESSKHFGIANPYQEEEWQSWKTEHKFESEGQDSVFNFFHVFCVTLGKLPNFLISKYFCLK